MQHLIERLLIAVAVMTFCQLIQNQFQLLIFTINRLRLIAFGERGFHLLYGLAEDKDIFLTHFLRNFDVRTIQRADG